MKTTMLKMMTMVLTLGAVGVVLGNASASDKTLEEISSYRQWTRVTHKPMIVDLSSLAG